MNDVLVVRDMSDYKKVLAKYPSVKGMKPHFVGQDLQRQLKGWVPDKMYVSAWSLEHDDWSLSRAFIQYRIAQGMELVCLDS